jgi:hypothetical protein
MPRINACKIFTIILIGLFMGLPMRGQDSAPTSAEAKGSIRFAAVVKIGDKNERLSRKRFYLIRGNRQQHAELLKQIAETSVTSRDCYFANLRQKGKKISDEYVCWLKRNDCESTFCREIKTTEEALNVPEFAAAYRQGLREYRQPAVALKWLNTNLSDEIRNGYYRQYKQTIEKLVASAKTAAAETTKEKRGTAGKNAGFQSIMTDRLGVGYFLDIDVVPPEGKKTETYLISNLLPIVFGDTSYVWTCELEIDPAKKQAPVTLGTEVNKKTKCEVISKKLSEICDLPDCPKPEEKPPAAEAEK